jgi:hypothetical protein
MRRAPTLLSRVALLAAVTLLATGCTNGQLVDAGGTNGQGGLAFVLLAVFFGLFLASLFYMDKVRQRKTDSDEVDNPSEDSKK